MLQENLDEAALAVQKVHADVLSDRMREIYSAVCNATGVTGIEDGTSGRRGRQETRNQMIRERRPGR